MKLLFLTILTSLFGICLGMFSSYKYDIYSNNEFFALLCLIISYWYILIKQFRDRKYVFMQPMLFVILLIFNALTRISIFL